MRRLCRGWVVDRGGVVVVGSGGGVKLIKNAPRRKRANSKGRAIQNKCSI